MRDFAAELGSLGYPGFAHLRAATTPDPADLLLTALAQSDLDVRVIEGLPWVVLNYPDLDWERLIQHAQAKALQNRLGYIVSLARQLADSPALAAHEVVLRQARLDIEDTLCENLTAAEREWLRQSRPPGAAQWNLLTGLSPGNLRYAA